MREFKPVLAAALAGLLANSLGGCAAYRVYKKCGLTGCAGDAQITAQVRAALTRHPVLAAPNQVYVQTLDGVVYLSGQVTTDLQRDTAEAAAREAAGARRVVDSIALTYGGR
jgi:osmotically-inducible protein OsmY